MSVTVVSCVYGDFWRFVPRWKDAILDLDPPADCVIVAGDIDIDIPGAIVLDSYCHWAHRQAYYLHDAVTASETDWVWIVDIDDLAHPDALEGLGEVKADVWLAGFDRSDGETYLPPVLSNEEFLALDTDPYPAGSFFRRDVFPGFSDVAFQDWALWRRLALNGASFRASDRTHYRYMRHPQTRGETELTMDARADHIAEMRRTELAYA